MNLQVLKNILFLFLFLIHSVSWSQFHRQTLSSIGGTHKTNSNIIVTQSIGQMGVIGNVSVNNKNIIQGFQQPLWAEIISKQNNPEFKINIFPVPFDRDITIQYDREKELKVFIFDIAGKLIYKSNIFFNEPNKKINLDRLKTGVYLIKVQSNQLIYHTKIIKR